MEKKSLADLVKTSPAPDGYKEKTSELTDKIIKLRDELNSARAEYQRILYMVNQ